MAIRITEDGKVIYENEPNVERELFPNIQGCCADRRTEIDELKENFNDLGLSVVDGAINITYEEATV